LADRKKDVDHRDKPGDDDIEDYDIVAMNAGM
jgi:hypothetical protein